MSWLTDLAEVYNNCEGEIGVIHGDEPVLLPIAHSTSNAQIEIVIDENGNFRRANTIEKADTVTVIPVTEKSCGRSNGISAHPLCDKLEYIAGDFCTFFTYPLYCNKKKDKEQKRIDVGFSNFKNKYSEYVEQLSDWVHSPFACKQIEAIYNYVLKCNIMKDLISSS
ncbi:MAG: type I-C CRISPR-associated protein Cas8c/Csd1, partial [Oscillospiraceae bacterium]